MEGIQASSHTTVLLALHSSWPPMAHLPMGEALPAPFPAVGSAAEPVPSPPPTPRTKTGKGHGEEEEENKHPYPTPCRGAWAISTGDAQGLGTGWPAFPTADKRHRKAPFLPFPRGSPLPITA